MLVEKRCINLLFNFFLGINVQTKPENSMKHHNGSESTRSQVQPSLNQTVETTCTPQPSQIVTQSPPHLIPVQESSCQQEGNRLS